MRTFMAKAEELNRKWYIIDAEGKPLGRVAAQAAAILRGKHLPTFTPHADCGDHVIIVNAAKAILTGNKADQKVYYRHTGWIGGLKETSYKESMEKFPTRAMTTAIKGMLPGNTLGAKALKRLRVYASAEHENQAQNPEVWTREIR